MPHVQIPATLRPLTANQAAIEIDGVSVGQVLDQLIEQFPQLQPHLFAHQHRLHSYVNLFVDGESIRDLEQLDTPIGPHQTLLILPALAGG